MKRVQNQPGKIDIIAVAKAAKVSASTVSRSFNHPGLVKPATRKKIDAAVKRLGYIRNRAAQAMHGRRSGTIGLIVPTINHAIFAEVIQSFSDAVEAAGFTILITSHGYDLDREYAVLRKLMEHRVDGIAIIGLDHSEETYQLIEQQSTPAIAIWNHQPDSRIACVGADNVSAGRLAAQHLIDLGHRQIGIVFPRAAGNDRARDRWSGALAALKEAGVQVPDDWQRVVPYSIAKAKEACASLLQQATPPKALLCGNDVIAQGAVFAAHKLGLRLPRDLSVIGIGDFKGSEDMEPPLTTIRIPAQSIGQIAADQIVQMIAEPGDDILRQNCAVKFLERGTTAAV